MLDVAVSRRSLLGGGSAIFLVAGTGLLSYRVYDSAALGPGQGDAYDPWRHWRDDPGLLGAVGAAVLAASPHNTQPWIFGIRDGAVDVFVDATRETGSVDPFRREQHIGIGCAIENLALACAARGLHPSVTLMPDSARAAVVTVTPGAPAPGPLYDAIGDRHTNRGPYRAEAVPPDLDRPGRHHRAARPRGALDRRPGAPGGAEPAADRRRGRPVRRRTAVAGQLRLVPGEPRRDRAAPGRIDPRRPGLRGAETGCCQTAARIVESGR